MHCICFSQWMFQGIEKLSSLNQARRELRRRVAWSTALCAIDLDRVNDKRASPNTSLPTLSIKIYLSSSSSTCIFKLKNRVENSNPRRPSLLHSSSGRKQREGSNLTERGKRKQIKDGRQARTREQNRKPREREDEKEKS